jgi:hypothetical protein
MSNLIAEPGLAHVEALLDEAKQLEELHAVEADAADAELDDVLRLLRREESGHLQCDRARHAQYVQELIARLERWEHRR